MFSLNTINENLPPRQKHSDSSQNQQTGRSDPKAKSSLSHDLYSRANDRPDLRKSREGNCPRHRTSYAVGAEAGGGRGTAWQTEAGAPAGVAAPPRETPRLSVDAEKENSLPKTPMGILRTMETKQSRLLRRHGETGRGRRDLSKTSPRGRAPRPGNGVLRAGPARDFRETEQETLVQTVLGSRGRRLCKATAA